MTTGRINQVAILCYRYIRRKQKDQTKLNTEWR